MSAEYNLKEVTDAHYGKKQLVEIRKGLILVWELLRGFIFTSDNFVYKTSDGYVDKCVDQ